MTYLAYAGIGSRETPADILHVMRLIGEGLFQQGWILRSGGAKGADSAFEAGVDFALANTLTNGSHHYHPKEIYLPWKGFNNSDSELHPQNLPFSAEEIQLSRRMHPGWHRCGAAARKMHQRNLRQILGHPAVNGDFVQAVKFVVCWTEGGKLIGGTAQALRIAQSCDIPIINFGNTTNTNQVYQMLRRMEEIAHEFKEKLDGSL